MRFLAWLRSGWALVAGRGMPVGPEVGEAAPAYAGDRAEMRAFLGRLAADKTVRFGYGHRGVPLYKRYPVRP